MSQNNAASFETYRASCEVAFSVISYPLKRFPLCPNHISQDISGVILEPKWRSLLAPPLLITVPWRRPDLSARRSWNASMKLDLPDPLAPMSRLMGATSISVSRTLKSPRTAIRSTSGARSSVGGDGIVEEVA